MTKNFLVIVDLYLLPNLKALDQQVAVNEVNFTPHKYLCSALGHFNLLANLPFRIDVIHIESCLSLSNDAFPNSS